MTYIFVDESYCSVCRSVLLRWRVCVGIHRGHLIRCGGVLILLTRERVIGPFFIPFVFVPFPFWTCQFCCTRQSTASFAGQTNHPMGLSTRDACAVLRNLTLHHRHPFCFLASCFLQAEKIKCTSKEASFETKTHIDTQNFLTQRHRSKASPKHAVHSSHAHTHRRTTPLGG
jgi:hypothetical protein